MTEEWSRLEILKEKNILSKTKRVENPKGVNKCRNSTIVTDISLRISKAS